jgi:hypothetical protein
MARSLRGGVATGILLFTALGCSLAGPKTVRVGRGLWNTAVQQTDNEQLLLNLVRLRYSDTPFFLEVTSVSTNFTFTSRGDAGVLLPSGGSSLFNLGASAEIAENPTITYTPVDGEQFVREVLSPIDMPTLLLLFNSGWGAERIVRVCVQSINGIPNAPTGSGPTPAEAPVYQEFKRGVRMLAPLNRRGALQLGITEDEDVLLKIDPSVRDAPELRELRRIFGPSPDTFEYEFTDDVKEAGPGTLVLVTRSVMSSLFYLSHNVDAPAEHVEAGKVTISQDPAGDPFDWDEVSGDLFQIRVAEDDPGDAYVAVQYRGYSYYIEDSDLASKGTFALLHTLFMLQSRGEGVEAPILTLPVSR